MIPKSGNRFSEKIMHEQNVRSDFDSIGTDRTLAAGVRLADAVLHGEALIRRVSYGLSQYFAPGAS